MQKKHKINLCKALCNCFYNKKGEIIFFLKSREYLKNKLSIENILRSMINLDLLKILIFDTRDYKEFSDLPKLELRNLEKLHLVNIKDDYNIDDKEFSGLKYENKFINIIDNLDN